MAPVETYMHKRAFQFTGANPPTVRRQAGLSLVEMLVGVVVGLVVASMAGIFLVGSIKQNKQLLVEIRLMSDMRAAMDLVTRELRRAGYWKNATSGLSNVPGYKSYWSVPYTEITLSATAPTIEYSYATDTNDTKEDSETFGFTKDGGTLKLRLSTTNGYQELTDPSVTTVTGFTITPTTLIAPVNCANACTVVASLSDSCPKVTIRSYQVVLQAQSANTSAADTITRELRSTVRVRNDIPTGSCS